MVGVLGVEGEVHFVEAEGVYVGAGFGEDLESPIEGVSGAQTAVSILTQGCGKGVSRGKRGEEEFVIGKEWVWGECREEGHERMLCGEG